MSQRSRRRSTEVDYAKFYKPSERRKSGNTAKTVATSCSATSASSLKSSSTSTSATVESAADKSVKRRRRTDVDITINSSEDEDIGQKLYKPCVPLTRRRSAPDSSAPVTSSRTTTRTMSELAVEKRQETSMGRATNAQKMVEKLEALLEKAKSITTIDDEVLERTNELSKAFKKILRAAETRSHLVEKIPALCDAYPMICFEGITEAQLCDLVWSFLSLDEHHIAVHDTDKEESPTFYKVLYWLDKAIRDGHDEGMTKRWPQELIDRFWTQMY